MAKWVVAVVVAIDAALFAVPAPAGANLSMPTVTTYTYDAPAYDTPENCTAAERGPPVNGYANASYDTVRLRLLGTLVRPDGLSARATYDYDDIARTAHAARGTGRAEGRGGVVQRHHAVVPGLRVAAKALVLRVVSSFTL